MSKVNKSAPVTSKSKAKTAKPGQLWSKFRAGVVKWFTNLLSFITFTYLLILYLLSKIFALLARIKFLPKSISNSLNKTGLFLLNLGKKSGQKKRVSQAADSRINRMNLINLSFKNMMTRRGRSLVTIGGMSLGIGSIVFLVSLGYGVQALVVNRVARLEELSQAEVNIQPGSLLRIDDEVVQRINDIPNVESVLPMISVVARINYQDSVTDMPVYGVTSDYLEASAIQPVQGDLFASNDFAMAISAAEQQIEVTDRLAEAQALDEADINKVNQVQVDMDPDVWFPVRESPHNEAKIIGYTRRGAGKTIAEQVIGDYYYGYEGQSLKDADTGEGLAKWIKADFLIWQKEDGQYVLAEDRTGNQEQLSGYTTQLAMNLEEIADPGVVLGTSTVDIDEILSGANLDSSDSADLELLAIASASGSLLVQEEAETVTLHEQAIKQAVVNTSMLEVLGLEQSKAVGQTFNVEFVVTTELLDDGAKTMESMAAPYEIVGVINEGSTPFFYVPFIDLRTLGITHYSQLKFAVDKDSQLADARFQVEGLGFATQSVADTVAQIDQLFSTVRLLLAALGVVALGVAALGMFNTLTVSLMERTREVGLMKAMGMKSFEVKDLFMTESMIMGLTGGLGGVVFGFAAGELLSLIISARSLTKGLGYIHISNIPLLLLVFVIALSLAVGIATGYYPAKRATKISALNALRYE